VRRFWLILCVLLAGTPAWAGDYELKLPETGRKTIELGGRLEFRPIFHEFDKNAAIYRFKYIGKPEKPNTLEYSPQLELKFGANLGRLNVYIYTHHDYHQMVLGDQWTNNVYEGYITFRPVTSLTFWAGKKSISWGKGYAWNPVGFINRPKDPDDPNLSLEGFTLVGFDYVKSLKWAGFKTVSLTALVMPVFNWDTALGKFGDVNAAFKLYILFLDTDLDFIYFVGPNQPASYGFDFSRNLGESIELHGEIAWRTGTTRYLLDGDGQRFYSSRDQLSYLLGLKYVTTAETTFIWEYYRNGQGYNRGELDQLYTYLAAAWRNYLRFGKILGLRRAESFIQPYLDQVFFGRDYLYFKVSQKDLFSVVDFVPWVALVTNLNDSSFSISFGATYKPVTNLELGFRVGCPIGPAGTEFGDKPDSLKIEFWTRFYF
jgi:hypothetical protein